MKPNLTKKIANLISAILRKLKWGSLVPERAESFKFDCSKFEKYFSERETK